MRLPLDRRAALQALWLAAPAFRPAPLHAATPGPALGSGFQTRSGLQYIDFREGSGVEPRFGQLIRFHYVGYTVNQESSPGLKLFDSSYDRTAPYFTKHGNGLTCQGIEEALHTMRVGGRRRIVLPPTLGYTGDKGPLPPGSGGREQLFASVSKGQSLVFDLELVSAMDDLLDRGDYDDLSAEEAQEVFKKRAEDQATEESDGDDRQFGRGVV